MDIYKSIHTFMHVYQIKKSINEFSFQTSSTN